MAIRGIAVELSLWIAIGVAVATYVLGAEDALSHTAAAGLNEPATTWVVESDLGEPFVTCTTGAGVTSCSELDLMAGTR